MANPFPQDVTGVLHPSGPFVSFHSGPLQGRVYRQSGHIELAGPDLSGAARALVIQFAPPCVHTAAGDVFIGELVSSAPVPNGLELRQRLGAAVITARLTFPHEGVLRYEVTDWGGVAPIATAVASPSGPDEHFYGFGERFINFDAAGRSIRVLTFDEPGVKTDHAYKVAPWFVSSRGYGFHLDSEAESTFDMHAEQNGRYVVANFFSGLALQVVFGPGLPQVLTRFTGYAGRPPLPPPFAFGPWISSDIWRSGGEVRYAVTQFRQRGIPVSAFVFDSPWEVSYNDFQFNMTQFGRAATIDGENHAGFGSLSEMMAFFQTNGLKVICWMTPFVNVSSVSDGVPGQNMGKVADYDDMAVHGLFARASANGPPLVVPWWKGHGSPIDFTNPAARLAITNKLNALLGMTEVTTRSGTRQSAIGGFKTDDGESGNGPNTYIPAAAHYADGRTGVEMRNAYSVEYQRTIWHVMGEQGILFARSGFVGSQAFPGSWAGDNEPNFGDNGLPSVIVAGQSAAMSGYAIWGHDTGGYQDTNFSVSRPSLFMRWTQFGCFSPIMQMHRQVSQELQYPWRYGQQALDNYRFYATLHTRLFPYIYTYAKIASSTGLPIIRPLVLMSQTDANTFGLLHVYHFGDELLVAPMIQPSTVSRQVYLPEGVWFDFWTSERHSGKQSIVWTDHDPMHFPVFVREGAIVPMLPGDVQTLCEADYVNNAAIRTQDARLQFLIYPAASSRFTMFDGTEVTCDTAGTGQKITVSSRSRSLSLQIHAAAAPASVTLNGTALTVQATAATFNAATNGWRFDGGLRAVLVRFEHPGGTAIIQL